MNIAIPSSAEVREAMSAFTLKQIAALASLSGVPVPTLYKIKRGLTASPSLDTVRKFLPHLSAACKPGKASRSPKG